MKERKRKKERMRDGILVEDPGPDLLVGLEEDGTVPLGALVEVGLHFERGRPE